MFKKVTSANVRFAKVVFLPRKPSSDCSKCCIQSCFQDNCGRYVKYFIENQVKSLSGLI